jgi:putative membrane protein
VDKLRVKVRGNSLLLCRSTGEAFGKAYIEAMIKGHGEVLEMIDNQLLKDADNAALKKHLTEARGDVAKHLDEAKKIQANLK